MTAETLDHSSSDHGNDQNNTAPHNIEAEQALLGALLFDNEVYNRVGDWLEATHFYDPVHARIYETATHLIGRGQLADARSA